MEEEMEKKRRGYVDETNSVSGREEYGGFHKKKLKAELEVLEHEAFGQGLEVGHHEEGGGGLEEIQQELASGFHADLSMLEHLPGSAGRGTSGNTGPEPAPVYPVAADPGQSGEWGCKRLQDATRRYKKQQEAAEATESAGREIKGIKG
ncbi:uncharacterized protein T551_02978 [Pneumocystis jirovecii RU7]|uniref:Uncharacterized protein n=1 Tax=Pneumocystis jirovecii (strain RU7) TaxID=1408657 RepID=A0A0W4ZGI4_PNEJ7|nr:uncharacterized protein T551_02978 [Pneumocystis jirovecii RU7]KTW27479.1 hypothetical protein T551_02978 [Pneumocystis jirovecii RU7]